MPTTKTKKKRKISGDQKVLRGIHRLNISSRAVMKKVRKFTLREMGHKK